MEMQDLTTSSQFDKFGRVKAKAMLKIKTKYAGGFLRLQSHRQRGHEGPSSTMSNHVEVEPEEPGLSASDYAILEQRRLQQNASTVENRSSIGLKFDMKQPPT